MKKALDIGCSGFVRVMDGFAESDVFGVDIVPHPESPHIKQADLIIDPIPFADNEFELVTAFDFLEHVPMVVYLGRERRQCMIELFNEIYRVLQPGGRFFAKSPCYPNRACFQDPQHLSVWTDETPNYFSGDYYGWKEHYGHKSNFILIEKSVDSNSHLNFTLEAVK